MTNGAHTLLPTHALGAGLLGMNAVVATIAATTAVELRHPLIPSTLNELTNTALVDPRMKARFAELEPRCFRARRSISRSITRPFGFHPGAGPVSGAARLYRFGSTAKALRKSVNYCEGCRT